MQYAVLVSYRIVSYRIIHTNRIESNRIKSIKKYAIQYNTTQTKQNTMQESSILQCDPMRSSAPYSTRVPRFTNTYVRYARIIRTLPIAYNRTTCHGMAWSSTQTTIHMTSHTNYFTILSELT